MKKILDKEILVNQTKCFACGSSVKISYQITKVEGPKEWDEVSFYAPVLDCSTCEKEVFAPEFHKIEHEAMCIAAGVLTPEEITDIRNKLEWGKNNKIFSLILGFGSSTIARYESCGSIPSKVHNRILTLLKFPNVAQEFEKGEEYEKWLKSSVNQRKVSKQNDDDIKDYISSDELHSIFGLQNKNETLNINKLKASEFSL